MTGRKISACSDKCRAARSRRRRIETQTARDERLKGLVKVLAKELDVTAADLT